MKYYHITDSSRLPSIWEKGLVPGKSRLFGEVSLESPEFFKNKIFLSLTPEESIEHKDMAIRYSGIPDRPWILLEIDIPEVELPEDEYGYSYTTRRIRPTEITRVVFLK